MKESRQKQSISSLAALLLFAVFAVGILSVLLTGANAYRRLTERDRLQYDSRTCVNYVMTKLRQSPSPAAVSVTAFGDGDALLLREEIKGEEYLTRIYCHNGWMMELFTAEGGDFAPEDGEKLFAAGGMQLQLADGFLRAEIVDGNGQTNRFYLQLRGGEGAGA